MTFAPLPTGTKHSLPSPFRPCPTAMPAKMFEVLYSHLNLAQSSRVKNNQIVPSSRLIDQVVTPFIRPMTLGRRWLNNRH